MTRGAPQGSEAGDVPCPDERVDALIAQAAHEHPDALAVAAADGTLTYRELNQSADAVADHLVSLGVGAEEPVALCLPRSAALVVGALGILRSGAAYVALDPDVPEERLSRLLEDCGASVILKSPSLGSVADSSAIHPRTSLVELSVDGVATVCAGEPATTGSAAHTQVGSHPSPLAYIVYTSGSTGSPKGVLLEHAGLINLMAWHRKHFSITAADRGSQIASPGFDASVWEIWPYLAAGASVHIPPAEVRADPPALRDWLIANNITVSFLPTALAEQVAVLQWPAASALRLVLTGGDCLRQPPPAGLPFAVVNNYGVSEGTVVTTSGLVSPGVAGTPPIGSPIDGVHVVMVDRKLNAVPMGVVGELMVGGASVARGYLNQPQLTADKFVSPGWATSGERWYRTGDLCRLRSDGELEFQGRLDDQVQMRGVRIEPGEISTWLDQHPDVRASVIVAVGEGASERRLYAYLVPQEESRRPSRQELQDYLATYLPAQMIPSAFGWISEIPQTQNGKVDRAALPPPAPASEDVGAPLVQLGTGNELEEAVAVVVAELLGLDSVAPHDNFFLLGGHSLLGAQLIARIGDQFGVSLGLRTLFDNPTSAGLALSLESLIFAETAALTDEEAAQLLEELGARSYPDSANES